MRERRRSFGPKFQSQRFQDRKGCFRTVEGRREEIWVREEVREEIGGYVKD